eukprot:15106312-Ditylum_brightwellii.AAC.1
MEDFLPKQESQKICVVFLVLKLAEEFKNTLYTDLTGKFPATAQSGNKYVLIAYDYDSNAILAIPVPNRSDPTIIKAVSYIYDYLTNSGFKPALNVLDSEVPAAVKCCLIKTGAKYQLVEPNNNCGNTAEHAICTFKEHFIAELCTTDKDFPIRQWNDLIEQAFITLNLLCMSISNPQLSSYAHLNGQFDYNKMPLVPPGIRALIYKDPQNRTS